ncbi:superoxide dismutase [Cu-Zn]-like [Panulirus ornatus]|uniref:superoxide dismutase [Cu-Zn]-like n=1 Tax=Panulirus ornatus TaxID=150431 RepID=UPI003A895AC7
MGKCVAYVAAAVVFMGVGALIAGIAVWYTHPQVVEALTGDVESRYAECVLTATASGAGVVGTLKFQQFQPNAFVQITGNISGLTVGPHGFHVHQWGVAGASQGCKDAGGHYNPEGFNHSAPNSTERHVGDLGNIDSVDDGSGSGTSLVDIKDNVISLWGRQSIVGRSIVVHAGEDDLGLGGTAESLKTGAAGGRLACCNIHFVPAPVM